MKHNQLDHEKHRASGVRFPLCYLLNNAHTPENVGSIFRVADALGVEKICLSGCSAVPPHRKIKKTARSTEKHVPFSYHANATAALQELKQQGYRIVGLEITDSSVSLLDFRVQQNDKLCLVLGEERHGICAELLQLCDTSIHIPMLGVNSSMNVACACSIASYEITKQLSPIS